MLKQEEEFVKSSVREPFVGSKPDEFAEVGSIRFIELPVIFLPAQITHYKLIQRWWIEVVEGGNARFVESNHRRSVSLFTRLANYIERRCLEVNNPTAALRFNERRCYGFGGSVAQRL